MSSKTQPLLHGQKRPLHQRPASTVPLAVLVLMLSFTVLATWFVWLNSSGYQENAFDRDCEEVRMQIQSSLQTYVAFLRGTAGLFAASEEVTAQEFRKYVERLRIPTMSPGVQELGFSVRVRPEDAAEILQYARSQVGPNYQFWADHPSNEQHAILFLEPRDERNEGALGYNMHANPIQAKAMDRARDSGQATATNPIVLKWEPREKSLQAGFLVFVPVYSDGTIPETMAERRANLVGFVYAAFRAADFMTAATRGERLERLGFDVYDQVNGANEVLLYSHPQTAGKPGRLERLSLLRWAQHRWGIRFSGDVNLGLAAPQIIVPWVGCTGLVLSALFWGVTRRITSARREAEENAELAAQGRRLFERIAETMPDVLYVHDISREQNVYVNGQVAAVLGFKPEEIQGMGKELPLRLVHPDDQQAIKNHLKMMTHLRDGEILSDEARFRHANGSYRWLCFRSCIFTRSPVGKVQQILGVASDITERRATEEALRTASKSKDEFLAALSHELRTPLTPVLAVISGLEEDASLSSDIRSDLAMARRNVELEARLIDDLLDLTRVARGKLVLHMEAVDLRQVIEHATMSVVELREKGIHFDLQWEAAECHVWADRSRLVQLFWNILKNAGKFTHLGGHVWLRVWNEQPKGQERPQIVIACKDEGIGIPPETLPKIFNAFEQGDSRVTRQFGGLGLGLAISKAVAELHNGELVAASEGSGRGATFTIRLPTIPGGCSPATPLASGEPRDSLATKEKREEPAPTADGWPLNLLLVEDHADTAEILAKRLRRLGHRVTHAGTVAAAVQAAEEAEEALRPFDLMLSDLGLPDGTGFDLMKRLSEHHHFPGIALSGFGMDADVQRSAAAGFARHLIKPVDFEILQQAIMEVHAEARHPHAP